MTTLNFLLAHAVARTLEPGDEIVVTDLDHDANVSPWLLVAADHDLVVRQAPIRAGDGTLDEEALEALLGERTRVVAFTLAVERARHRSPTPARIAAAAHASARSPGRTPCTSPRTAGCAAASSGSTCCSARPTSSSGPHLGVAAIERELAESLPADRVRPAGGVAARAPLRDRAPQSHEAIAGTVAAVDYLRSLGDGGLDAAFERIRDHEEALSRRFLERRRRCRARAVRHRRPGARRERTPTFCFNLARPTAARARRPSGSASATSTCGTATTTRSRRCARSGCRSAARSGRASSTTRPRTRWTGCSRR